MAYAMTGTSLMPALVLVMAALDGSHGVQVCESAQGTQVLLKHHEGCYTPEILDHKRSLARLLVSLSALDPEGDHHLVSGHVAKGFINEREGSKPVVKTVASLNQGATSALIVQAPDRFRDVLVQHWTGRKITVHETVRILATVQMLI